VAAHAQTGEQSGAAGTGARSQRGMLAPLALTQFVASFAGSNMNVAISSISKDLDTTIHGVQTAITLFLLCMAALMIPGSKLTDIWGRKRWLIRAGFIVTVAGVVVLLAFVKSSQHVWAFLPGLFLIGLGIGVMLTPSVNIVQSSFPEQKQGEISGLSRSISSLGPSMGTAIAGTILVSDLVAGNRSWPASP
jgi:MFS family permease